MKKVLLITLMFLTACAFLPSSRPSILEDSTCDPPCWNNITVGKTTKQEMLDILTKIPAIDQDSITIVGKPWDIFDDSVYFNLYPDRLIGGYPLVSVQTSILNNKVVEMSFCGELGVTIGQIIDRTGEPNYVINVHGGEPGGLNIKLLNTEKGIETSYSTIKVPEILKANVDPRINIECLSYFFPDLWQNSQFIGLFAKAPIGSDPFQALRQWKGYGNIEEKYPVWNPYP